jgi:hypothetical protein
VTSVPLLPSTCTNPRSTSKAACSAVFAAKQIFSAPTAEHIKTAGDADQGTRLRSRREVALLKQLAEIPSEEFGLPGSRAPTHGAPIGWSSLRSDDGTRLALRLPARSPAIGGALWRDIPHDVYAAASVAHK